MKFSVDRALRDAQRLARSGDGDGAERVYREILAKFPGNRKAADALCALSAPEPTQNPPEHALDALVALHQQRRWQEALEQATALLTRYPRGELLHTMTGAILAALGRFAEAVAHYDAAITLADDYVEAYNARGTALIGLNRLDAALASFDRAIQLMPNYAEALFNRGNVLKMQRRLIEALASYDKAIATSPALAQAHNNRGVTLRALDRPVEALASHERALELRPDYALAYGEILDLRAHLGLWKDGPRDDGLLEQGGGNQAIPPFYMLGMTDDPARQLACAKAWAHAKFGGIPPVAVRAVAPASKIRVGYFSADFHDHATMYLIARLFELHDRERFEIHAFSYGGPAQDAMRRRLLNAVDHFHDVTSLDDGDVARHAQAIGLHIAVDLKGYTGEGRPGIFAHRPAPVQVSYLGYPGTLGTGFMDYILADPIVIPAGQAHFYAERLLHLPNSYQANDDRRLISDRPFTRRDAGLPDDAFVFCCFNNSYKITACEFDVWMRLLAQVEGSVLWLLRGNAAVETNLRREAARRGVDAARLVFADKVPSPEHLARHRCADLFLDTFRYNAHTTASDALWAGLPVLTKLGHSFAARVAGSLLHAVGMPELVTETVEEYERLALAIARDRDRPGALKDKLAQNRHTAPLFDSARFVRDLEAIYARIAREEANEAIAA